MCAQLLPAGRWLLLFGLLLLLAACAQPAQRPADARNFWSGRLALQVEDHPSQSFSALFELRGDARAGDLVLTSPLGNRVAQLDWQDGHARLVTGSQDTRTSDSLDELLQQAAGTQIPVAALFSWLQGMQASARGWEADLSGIEDGRLIARRTIPAPHTTLRIALTR